MYFRYFIIIPWKKAWSINWTNLNPLLLCAKFDWNCHSLQTGRTTDDKRSEKLKLRFRLRWAKKAIVKQTNEPPTNKPFKKKQTCFQKYMVYYLGYAFFFRKNMSCVWHNILCAHNLVSVSYTHLRAHETSLHLVCRLLLEKIFAITWRKR